MEQDKKYNITMGLMVFCFVVIVAIALGFGLGYIKIGSKNDNVDANVGNAGSGVSGQVESKEEGKEAKTDLKDAYKKYGFDWASKKEEETKNEIGNVYVQDGKVKIVGSGKPYYNGTTYDIPKKIIEVDFEYGNPLLAEVATYYDFMSFVVITDDGEVYISEEQEVPETGEYEDTGLYFDVNKLTYTKIDFNEKIVDVALLGDASTRSHSGPYYMTNTGKVITKEGITYEEINK